jgi:POT family proton-dependent oligopeptide transporter
MLVAVVMYTPAVQGGAKVSPTWLIAMYLILGISEVLVWTGQLSLTSRLAPQRLSAIFIGGWYVNIGIGTWLTG